MAWSMSGQVIEACSCKMLCPCYLGPAEPDQGWCSGSLVLDIRQGNSDGASLAGRKVVWAADLPGDFVGGNATARLYIDEGASPDQRRELEAIFSGKKGGPWEIVSAAVVTKWLPTQFPKIDIQWGGNPSVSVGGVGQVKLQPLKDETGRQTKVTNAPAMLAFGLESNDLARSDGTQWSDPEMRSWQGGGSGSVSSFNWSG